jgi:predicted kinase
MSCASEAGYNGRVTSAPTLIVVEGPPGSGKTTLARKIAAEIGCPAICRDEIKEGMARSAPGFVARLGDDLTIRTFPVFFSALELLVRAGVTTVAEAAFQDRVWRLGLEPLMDLADLRIVRCTVSADLAFRRVLHRRHVNPLRSSHADPGVEDKAEWTQNHRDFDHLSIDAPFIKVNTTSGYRPGLPEVVDFVARLSS